MNRSLSAAGAIALISLGANAQSFNVDIDAVSPNAGNGVPVSSYDGAALQAGTWNSISSATPTTSILKNLNGTISSATFTRATNGSFSGGNLMGSDFGLLYNDWQQIPSGGGDLVFSFNNLQAGDYLLYTYAHNTGTGGVGRLTDVEVTSAAGPDVIQCGGFLSANAFSEFGVSHIIHSKTVSAGGSITVKIRSSSGFPGVVNGFQLVKLASAFPVRKYVDDSAAFSFYNGDSWTEPYKYLTDALNFASMVGGGNCEIWVAQGFYYPPKFQSSTDRNASFVIPSGLKLYGGFAGTETSLSQRTSPAFFITAMSGSINSSAQTDNSYNVVVADGTGTSTLVDGFSITRGRASGSSANNQDRGAGVRIINGSPQFRNCKFISNQASFYGGGVHVSGGIPTFTDCLFYQNDCYNGQGGGIASTSPLNLRLVNCQFLGNSSIGDGGGAYLGNGPAEIVNCMFSGNAVNSSLGYGGAVYATGESADLIIRNTTVSGNFCAGSFGGVAARNGADISAYNSIFWGNTDTLANNTLNENLYVNENQLSFLTTSHITWQGLAGAPGADPQFVDADGNDNVLGTTDDNCRLQLTSPCIDSGSNTLISADITDINQNGNAAEQIPVDLDGNARRTDVNSVPDTGSGTAPIVDRGAYERIPPPCVGDLNHDGAVNTVDLVIFLGQFGQSGSGLSADFDGNGTVNTQDLTRFLGVFGVPCP